MRRHRVKLPAAAALAVFLGGLVISICGAFRLAHSNDLAAAGRFHALAERATAEIARQMRVYEEALSGAQALIAALDAENVTSEQLRRHLETLDFAHRMPGAAGIGIIRRAGGLLEQSSGQRYLVQFVALNAGHTQDSWTNTTLDLATRDAIERSGRNESALLSAPLLRPPGSPRPPMLALILPLNEPAPTNRGSRPDENTNGAWVYAPLQIDRVLEGIDFGHDEVSLALTDTSAADKPVLFASSTSAPPAVTYFEIRLPIYLYGRTWEARISAQPQMFAALAQRDPRREMIGGIALSTLVGAVVFIVTRRRIRVHAETARRISIILASGDAALSEALDGTVTVWAPACQEIFGYRREFAVGRALSELIVPDECVTEDTAIREALTAGSTVLPIDTVRQARDGTLIHLSMFVSCLRDADGRICGFSRIFREPNQAIRAQRRALEMNDALEQKVSERTVHLESAHSNLRMILDSIPAMISYWDKDLRNVFMNRANEKWLGGAPKALSGRHIRELIGDELFSRDLLHIEAALRGESRTFEQSVPDPFGPGIRHSLTSYIPDAENGAVCGFYVMVFDVSELANSKLQLAVALRENEELLRTLDMHSKISITDAKGFITYVNENFCTILGYSRDEVLGRPHSIIKSGVQSRAFWAQMWDTISAGRPWRGEICNRGKDGSLHWVDAIIAPFLGKDGRVQKYVSIGTNISASRETERRLRSNEAFLERIGTIAGVGGWEFDLGTREVTWSSQTCRMLEVESGYVPRPETEFTFYLPEERPIIENAVDRCKKYGIAWDLELRASTAKGRPIWIRSIGAPEWKDGRVARLIGAVQDVTARKSIETQLQDSSDRFAIAADSAGIGVWEMDSENDVLTWDSWMYRMYGVQKGPKLKNYAFWLGALHPDDRLRCEAEAAAASRGPDEFISEFRIVRPSGEVRYIKAASRADRSSSGRSLRTIGVNFDVTDARHNEMVARRETVSLLQTVLDCATEISIIATDANLIIKVFNSGAEQMLGFTSAEVVGKQSLSLILDAVELEGYGALLGLQADYAATHDSDHIASIAGRSYERIYVRKDRRRINVSLFIQAMRSEEGDILGYVCVARDITQQNEDQNLQTHAVSKAENANKAKSQFLANMSHEIRTPMNAVMGLSYLLSHTPLTAEQSSLLAKIQVASNSLLSVITNVLDLSKIEANELLMESTVFSPSDLLRDVAVVMTVQAEAKGIQFVMDTPNDLPEALTGDPTRVKQILVNLLSNAIRFTLEGTVRFTTSLRASTATEKILTFTIADTGIGIAPEDQDNIFAPFSQADASITRRYGGTGLGLSIVKELTQLLRGTVELESVPGIGSTFSVALPFEPAAHIALTALQVASVTHGPGALRGVRALIVDDNEINLEVAKRILELDGAQVWLAADGQQALDRLRREPDAFDVVLMDIQMPILDGYEATRRIRGELGLVSLPIIAVTAGALSSERQRADDAGMTDFICKPFSAKTLTSSILSHVSGMTSRRPTLQLEDKAPPPIVDVSWPEIDGIETTDAAARWCGDAPLFLTMLSRLFDEYGALHFPANTADPSVNAQYVRRMHKLRGGACMLGAKGVYGLAGEVEAACLEGKIKRAAGLTARLSTEIQRLSKNAQSAIDAERVRAEQLLESCAAPIAPDLMESFNALLLQQSLEAVHSFRTLSVQLRRYLGLALFEQLRLHMDSLQFDEAYKLLKGFRSQDASAQKGAATTMIAVN